MSTRVYRSREMIDRTGFFIVEASGHLPVLGFKYMYPFLHKKRQLSLLRIWEKCNKCTCIEERWEKCFSVATMINSQIGSLRISGNYVKTCFFCSTPTVKSAHVHAIAYCILNYIFYATCIQNLELPVIRLTCIFVI